MKTIMTMTRMDTKIWRRDGLIHREDGPAVIFTTGHKEWWLNGVRYDPMAWMLKVHELFLSQTS